MTSHRLISLITSLLILLSSGCGLGIDINLRTEQKTGPTITDDLSVPLPASGDPIRLNLAFGAGKLVLLPSPRGELVSGTATYNVADFQPDVEVSESTVVIRQGNLKLNAVPTINDTIKNEWSLGIGSHPLDLTIKSGAYTGDFEFGGLAITDLHITDGAANVQLAFSMPNQEVMRSFRYETGASNISMEKLANANFQTMIFQSGGGNYSLDFSGNLQQDTNVFIETGLSRLVIAVPEDMSTEVSFEGPLSNVNAKGSWEEFEGEYINNGNGPKLMITVETKAGITTLKHP